jgi:hypothetical protein
MEYRVIWEIEVLAETIDEAVEIALQIQRDPASLATHFTVVTMPDEYGVTKENSL